ncbi:MAG: hypothetical protein AB7F50_11815 [Fimbriimonadaceae bacterium]
MQGKLLALAIVVCAIGCSAPQNPAGDPATADRSVQPATGNEVPPGDEFEGKLRPMLVTSCSPCHVGDKPQKGINVEFVSEDDKDELKEMHSEIEEGKMPPKTGKPLDDATKAELLSLLAEAAK